MSTDVETRLQEFAGELKAGNLASVSRFVAPVFFEYEPLPGEPTATERFVELSSDLKAAMPDLTVTLRNVEQAGDVFTADLHLAGTHEFALWGAPGSGRHITWDAGISIKPIGDRFALLFDEIPFPEIAALLREFGLVNPPDEMDQPPKAPVSPPEFLLKVVFTGQAGDKACSHLEDIRVTEPSTRVCVACYEVGDNWPALRMCLICGFVGCCDTSKNKHMGQHHQETGHPIMRSIRMDEGWIWCYEDSALFEKHTLDRYR